MKKFDNLLFGLIIGGFFPLLLLFLTFVGWFYFDQNEADIPYYLITASLAALAIDLKYLKGLLTRKYELPIVFAIFIYLFYNVMLWGFLMGVPLLNAFTGIFLGYYSGRRIQWMNFPPKTPPQQIRMVSYFNGGIMTLICVATAFIGLAGNGAGSELRHMLGLGFELTRPMLWAITATGGICLVLFTVISTRITMIQTLRKSSCHLVPMTKLNL